MNLFLDKIKAVFIAPSCGVSGQKSLNNLCVQRFAYLVRG